MSEAEYWRGYHEAFVSDECKAAFKKYNGTRVCQEPEDWNAKKWAFEAAWRELEPYKSELLKIAEGVGEPKDPFAAWEKIAILAKAGPRS